MCVVQEPGGAKSSSVWYIPLKTETLDNAAACALGSFFKHGWSLISTRISTYMHYRVWNEITSMVQPLKLGNEQVISSHTLLGIWLLIHAGIYAPMPSIPQQHIWIFSSRWLKDTAFLLKIVWTSINLNFPSFRCNNSLTDLCKRDTLSLPYVPFAVSHQGIFEFLYVGPCCMLQWVSNFLEH